jgi:hypothetical protein
MTNELLMNCFGLIYSAHMDMTETRTSKSGLLPKNETLCNCSIQGAKQAQFVFL